MIKVFKKPVITEDEAWEIWKSCGKLAGVDYYEYALKIIQLYEDKSFVLEDKTEQ